MLDVPWHEFWSPAPEPRCGWLPITEEIAQYRDLSNHGRVFFYGEGPDNAMLYEWRPYLTYLARAGSWGRLSADVLRHAVAHRRIPLIPSAARALTDYAASKRLKPRFPPWLNGEFVSRLGLLSMWKAAQSPASIHPVRPRGYASFEAPLWQQLFNSFDSGSTESPVEVRHPYVDLRLLRYMLAIPAIPWCREKHLLRRAMRGILPDQVLRRPKAPLSANPLFEAVRRRRMRPPVPTEQLFQYVDPAKIDLATSNGVDEFWLHLRPVVLNNWLQNFNASNSRTEGEMRYGSSTEA
jgi:asparagine synthase (glutamine-hydrolysing)